MTATLKYYVKFFFATPNGEAFMSCYYLEKHTEEEYIKKFKEGWPLLTITHASIEEINAPALPVSENPGK